MTYDKRKKIFKVIDKAGIVLHFGSIKGESATRETFRLEAQKILGRNGKTLTPSAWIALGKKTGFQLRPSLNELQKLISFVGDREVDELARLVEVVRQGGDGGEVDIRRERTEDRIPIRVRQCLGAKRRGCLT